MTEKKSGSVFNILPLFLGIITITVISLMYIHFVRDMDIREQAGQIARQYMLEMESTGYLTADAQTELIDGLRAIGMNSINLSGTTMEAPGYGNEIALVINARVPVTRFDVSATLQPVIDKEETDYHFMIRSTAKN